MRDIRDLVERLRKNDSKAQVHTGHQPPFSIQGEAADEIERLRNLCSEAVERDAARYRWLRSDPPVTLAVRRGFPAETERGCYLDGENLDAAIDAAMSAQSGDGESK